MANPITRLVLGIGRIQQVPQPMLGRLIDYAYGSVAAFREQCITLCGNHVSVDLPLFTLLVKIHVLYFQNRPRYSRAVIGIEEREAMYDFPNSFPRKCSNRTTVVVDLAT